MKRIIYLGSPALLLFLGAAWFISTRKGSEAMEFASVPSVGEVVSFTTLHSPPEGFKAPLHIALVELDGGARLFCHGEETRGVKIGSRVAVEAVDSVFYFSHMGFVDRARLFWRRTGARGEKVASIGKSLVKGFWKGRSRDDD